MRESLRIFRNRLFATCVFGSGLVTIGLLMASLGLIIWKGAGSLSWAFLMTPMKEAGLSGGIAYQIVGTLILLTTALVLVAPVSLAVALFRNVYLRASLQRWFTVFLYLFNGTPSVLFGLFGFWFFVKRLGWERSWLAGGILLAMMILPTVALTFSESMHRIPAEYIEQARALGLRRSSVVWSVLVPQSLAGAASGVLLGLARAAGETAPIMFTATVFAGVSLPHGVVDSPVLSLPYHIFNLVQESYDPRAIRNGWATACVLIALSIGLSLCALPLRLRLHEEAAVK